MNKAVLLVGNIRTWEHCKQSFIDNFSDCDVFLSTYDLKYGYHPVLMNRYQDFSDEFLSDDYILNLFNGINLKSFSIEKNEIINNVINEENDKLHPSMKNIHSSYGQYRKLKHSLELLMDYEQLVNKKYDVIIRTRCDMIYGKDVNFPVVGNQILHNISSIPGTEFIPDQVVITSRDNMISISNFIFNEFYEPIFDDSHMHPPHGLLRNAIRHLGLIKIEKDIFTGMIRKNGLIE